MEKSVLFFKDSIDIESGKEGTIAVKRATITCLDKCCDIAVELIKKPVNLKGFYNVSWITFDKEFNEEYKKTYFKCLDNYLINLSQKTSQDFFFINNRRSKNPYFYFVDNGKTYSMSYLTTDVEMMRGDMHKVANMFFGLRHELSKKGYEPVHNPQLFF
jgi:hypothetical protein